jgi:hypothetical protein
MASRVEIRLTKHDRGIAAMQKLILTWNEAATATHKGARLLR